MNYDSKYVLNIQEFGRPLVYVPLGKDNAKAAILYKDDYEFVLKLGTSNKWTATKRNCVTCNCSGASGYKLSVARIMLDCGKGEKVTYLDGNPLNLRRENLRKQPSKRTVRRDRDVLTNFVRSQEAKRVAA